MGGRTRRAARATGRDRRRPGPGAPRAAGTPRAPWAPPPALAHTLDPALADALRRTQRRLGLSDDGVIGPKTRAALNVPAPATARPQIRQALDRVPAVPASGRFVLVNVAEYRVRAFEDGKEVLSMRTVVGANEEGHRTPLFSDEIEYATFRPFWNVPTADRRGRAAPRRPPSAGGRRLRVGPPVLGPTPRSTR